MSDGREAHQRSILEAAAAVANAVDPDQPVRDVAEPREIFAALQSPDLSKGVPAGLWKNLGIPDSRRGRIDGKGFLAEAYQPLIIRLNILTEHVLTGLAKYNGNFAESLVASIHRHAGKDYTTPVVNGVALAIEAYQIASDRSLLPGFVQFGPEDAAVAFQSFPDDKWWGMTSVQKMIDPMGPKTGDVGFFEDMRQIARYALRDDQAVGLGAVCMSAFIASNWPNIYAMDHPSYEPSRYADPNGGIPVLG